MTNLFKPSAPKPKAPTPTPDIDEATQNVDTTKRRAQMRGRAAAMLTTGQQQAPTAQRKVTGN